MKKCLVVLLLLVMVCSVFAGCTINQNNNHRLTIVCTIFPQYDWLSNLIKGIDCEIILLADSTIDLHSFNPTAQDIVTINNADIFVYNGGESDEWVKDVLKATTNTSRTDINFMNVANSVVITSVEEDEEKIDEHVWFSITNVCQFCDYMCGILSVKLPDCKETFEKNATEYKKALQAMADEYRAVNWTDYASKIIIADRYPFEYLKAEYEINFEAAYHGCSAEIEVSFDTILHLAKLVDENQITKICVTENSDKKIANQVVSNCQNKSVEIKTLNSMQSLTKHDIGKTTYIDIMKENLSALKEVCGL